MKSVGGCVVGLIGVLSLAAPGVVRAQAPLLPRDDLPATFGLAAWPYGLGDRPAGWPEKPPPARLALGRALFFSPILSADHKVACASCHQPAHGFSTPDALPPGVNGEHAARHPPSLFNRALGTLHSWDGRAPSLKEQVVMPIENPVEMGLPLPKALDRLRSDQEWAARFETAFGDREVTKDRLSDALASFVSRITHGDTAVDRFQGGRDRNALSVAERTGLWIYESKGRCWMCHSGPNFTDEGFHNTGIGSSSTRVAPGRSAVTGDGDDRGRFRTPTLRGLALTAPYMHDGSVATLKEVVAFYRGGGRKNANLDPRIRPLDLTDEDAAHLLAFLKALSRRGG
ncbi:MAG: cytochrome-c peroxidase [Planctomycetes bacterium]|nr:cytochrome-c peroxidase [Planctomycetota bacterium]